MRYYSLQHQSPEVSFEEAVVRGLAPDKGLYFPKSSTSLPPTFFEHIEYFSNEEIAFEVIKQFVGDEIPTNVLQTIVAETISFDFPLVKITDKLYTLELFHGPTMAFKDVGARFMARCLGYFNSHKKGNEHVTVLVATSGDTGGAVASGFLGVEGVNVVILYPKGKVSEVQEKQLTTLGKNITALCVDGNFDDCQAMVKTAFLDEQLTKTMKLTSANSINVARWLPQMMYYFFAYKQLKNKKRPIVVSVPSGNFGNICAGLMAKELGLPIAHFVASTNVNDTVPQFLATGAYAPKTSIPTISNAMDVSDPSNFVRILELFQQDTQHLKEVVSSYSFTDSQTKEAMKELYEKYTYIADPHGAVGYLGLQKVLKEGEQGIFLETAHPVKFLDNVEPIIQKKIEIPTQIREVMDKPKVYESIATYEELKAVLLSN